MEAPYHDRFFHARDGLQLYAREYAGDNATSPTVLCLPGLTRNSADFADLASDISPRFRVLAVDLRGRGRSERDPDWHHYQPGVYVDDVLTLLDHLGVARVAVIGTSLGGLLAMMLGVTRPARIAGIVLNDIGPEIDPRGAARIREYAGRLPPVQTWAQAADQLRSTYGAAWPDLSPERWDVLTRRSYRESSAGMPELDYDPKIGEALRQAPATGANLWPLWPSLKSAPMLCIRGELSDILAVSTLERMNREKTDLQVVHVANRGHVPLLDEPQCVDAIKRFLSELDFARG